MPPVTGNDGTPSGFNPNAPFGVWGDSGSAGPFGPGGNGVVGSSGLSSGVAGFTIGCVREGMQHSLVAPGIQLEHNSAAQETIRT